MDLFTKTSKFGAVLEGVCRENENCERPIINKVGFDADFAEDLTAMLLAMRVVAGRITQKDWDILEFTHVLNKLAVQYLLKENEKKERDGSYVHWVCC